MRIEMAAIRTLDRPGCVFPAHQNRIYFSQLGRTQHAAQAGNSAAVPTSFAQSLIQQAKMVLMQGGTSNTESLFCGLLIAEAIDLAREAAQNLLLHIRMQLHFEIRPV